MERPELVESPRKRQKVEDAPVTDVVVERLPETEVASDAQTTKERDVGITELVTADTAGFSGILKKRYEFDAWVFLRNELTFELDTPISWSMRSHPPGRLFTSRTLLRHSPHMASHLPPLNKSRLHRRMLCNRLNRRKWLRHQKL